MGSLPTLNPPQPIDVGKLVQLKSLIQAQPYQQEALEQEQQSRALAIQEQQYQLNARQANIQAYKEAMSVDQNGQPQFDTAKLAKTLTDRNVDPTETLQHLTAYQKSLTDLQESKQKVDVAGRDAGGALGMALLGNPDPEFARSLAQQHLQDPNLDPGSRQQLQQVDQSLAGLDLESGKKMVTQLGTRLAMASPKYAEMLNARNVAQIRASGGVQNQELQSFIQNPPPGYQATPMDFERYQKEQNPANAGLQAYLKDPNIKGESLPISKRNAATYEAWKAKLAPQAQINVANAAGGGLSDPATDQAAWRYLQTGQLPPGTRGVVGLAQNRKIMNRAAELDPNASLAGNAAVTAANRSSLQQLQAQTDRVEAFENTAIKNMDMFLEKAKAVPDLGTRFANVPLRMITGKMIGDQKQAELQAALQTARTEAARVLSSASAAGVIPVEQQREVEDMLNGNLPYKAMVGVVATLKSDMANRKQSYNDQIGDIKRRFNLSGTGGGAQQNTAPLEITLPSKKVITIK